MIKSYTSGNFDLFDVTCIFLTVMTAMPQDGARRDHNLLTKIR